MSAPPETTSGSATPVADVSSRLTTIAMICVLVLALVGVAGVWSARRRVSPAPAVASPARPSSNAEPASHGTRD
jgi:hypothetical protein